MKLVESALMIALATVLSLIKLVDLPYGGSVTAASMMPLVIIAYRYGVVWGLFTGLAHGLIQFLLGTSVLSWVTGWQSIIAVILLDYLVAFLVIGLAGVFRGMKRQSTALVLGAILAGAARYICHVISGCTVWAGLSIPTTDALVYSLAYNATYMLPETIILAVAVFYLGSALDFRSTAIKRVPAEEKRPVVATVVSLVAKGLLVAAAVFATAEVFAHLQNADTGDFDITGLSNVPWEMVGIVCAVCVVFSVILFVVRNTMSTKKA